MANKRIIDLVAAGSVATTDLFEIDTGAASLKATGSQVATMVKSVAPAISQNAGVAFGVQQNNASSRTMLAIITILLSFDHLNPGIQQVDIITNASNPNPMATLEFVTSGAATLDTEVQLSSTVAVAPGGF